MRFEEQDKPWPFRACHITHDRDCDGLSGPGIISNRHLQGIQSEICHAIRHPTTIIEFAKDGKTVRSDSPLLTYAMHPSCSIFRAANLMCDEAGIIKLDKKKPKEGDLCLRCDSCHASIFRDMKESQLTIQGIMQRRSQIGDLKFLCSNICDHFFEPMVCSERLVLQYDCPFLGYRELLFPIIVEGKVIAVFFVGQITLEGQQRLIEDMIKSIHNRYPGCFYAYLNSYHNSKTPEDITEEILNQHNSWLEKEPDSRIVSPARYEKIILTTVEELKEFESLLVKEIDHQRIAYIRNNVSKEVEKFTVTSGTSGQLEKVDDHTLISLWDHVEDSMNRLVDCFSLRYALVFGVKRIIHGPEGKLEVVAKTTRWNQVFNSSGELIKLSIDTEGLPENYTVCSLEKNTKFLKRLRGCTFDNLGDFQLILVPVLPYPHSSIAILVGYDEKHPQTSPENQPGSPLDAALQSFDTVVVSSLAAILARGAEDTAKNQLKYLGHEAGQLVAGLDWLRLSYFENAWALKTQPANKIRDICQDLEGFIGQMSFVFNMASQIATGALPEVEMSEFKPFGEVLFKWKDTYRQEIERKCLHIRVAELVATDRLRPAIYADKFLFEQVVYNLVNNAEKYSYRGTKIHLDCRLRSIYEDRSPHVLTVTNYGQYMAPGTDVYHPFTRRETAGDVEGLGLGLYIAWMIIVKVFGGEISHHCAEKPISIFNIPLIKPYIERSFEEKDQDLASELETEFDRLRTTRLYDSSVAFADNRQTPKYEPSDDALRREIRKPTHKVTITATIPVQKRRDE